MEEIDFSQEEKDLINFISTSKNDVLYSVLYKWRPGCINEIDSLCSRFILEFNSETDTNRIHPLIRDHFYNELEFKMAVTIFNKEFYGLNEGQIEIEIAFKFKNSYVYTSENQIIIESIKELDEIDGAVEMKRYIRSDLLIIEGVLTYFTGNLFTAYQRTLSEQDFVEDNTELPVEIKPNILLVGGNDCSYDLNILLEQLEKKEKEEGKEVTAND